MTEEISDLDRFMSLEPPLCEADLDELISWHRAQRERRARGEKSDKPKIDLSKVLGLKAKPSFSDRRDF